MIWILMLIIRFWNWGIKTFFPYFVPGFIILTLAKAGAIFQNNLFIIAMIAGICVIILLVAFNKLNKNYYPHIIGSIGFAMLLQNTLISPGLIGSDIHTEYYFYNMALDGWDYTNPHPYNSAIGATVIAPFLTNVFRIPGTWIFKFIFPLLFAFVPYLLYFIFKKEFKAKVAFFSALFFIIVPTWSMELIGVPRQMLGELMLALSLYLIIVSSWKLRTRIILLIIAGTMGALFHYLMGPVIALYLGVGGFFLIFFKRRVFPIKWLAVILAMIVVSGLSYYAFVSEGMPLKLLTTGSEIVGILAKDALPSSAVEQEYTLFNEEPVIDPEVVLEAEDVVEIVTDGDKGGITKFITHTSPLIKAAWGGDFLEVDLGGKVFRIFQYLTQLSIVVGCVIIFKNRKKYSAEYLSFALAAILLLGVVMFLPHFASLINATRFYHLTLFLLAPAFVVGGQFIFRNIKLLAILLIIPYFLFTSGLVFEATQKEDITKISMPYAISLSNYRVDMVGVFTDNDMAVRDWAVENNIAEDTYADTHSQLLLWEKAYTYWKDFEVDLRAKTFVAGNYIFLSERNNEDQAIVLRPKTGGSSSGRRVSYSYSELGLDEVIDQGIILYQQGNAFIMEIKDGTD